MSGSNCQNIRVRFVTGSSASSWRSLFACRFVVLLCIRGPVPNWCTLIPGPPPNAKPRPSSKMPPPFPNSPPPFEKKRLKKSSGDKSGPPWCEAPPKPVNGAPPPPPLPAPPPRDSGSLPVWSKIWRFCGSERTWKAFDTTVRSELY